MSTHKAVKVSKSDRLKLEGLLAMARRHNAALKEIEGAAAEILREPEDEDYYGTVSDAVYCDYSVETLLRKLAASRGSK